MLISFKDKKPHVHPTVFLAEGSKLIGNIKIEENSSVWFNAVLRADVGSIYIDSSSNIQDGTVIHVSHAYDVHIGKNVTIGHNAIIHGAHIGDNTLIGMGSTILDGATIGCNCLIGAGALITQGTTIEDGMLVLGSPAKAIKPLSPVQLDELLKSANHYHELSLEYKKRR